jgi:steroid 5-alpha reductase family enzyme
MALSASKSWGAIALILLIGAAIAWAGSQHGREAFGLPLFALCGAFAFVLNWIVFVPSNALQTEHYFDLTGSLTYLSVVALALLLGGGADARALLIGCLVGIWAMRLGSFLFLRVKKDGSDGRFDDIKPDFPRFLMTWTLQGLWVFLTLACGLAAMTSASTRPIGAFAVIGAALWAVGFAIEALADHQKRVFRADPAQQGRFITTGLWAWSRHPNYFGEILLWVGIAVIALPALQGWQHVTLISPVFVYLLLTRISGIPMLESRGKQRWGDDPEYRAYKAAVPVLVPRPPRRTPT